MKVKLPAPRGYYWELAPIAFWPHVQMNVYLSPEALQRWKPKLTREPSLAVFTWVFCSVTLRGPVWGEGGWKSLFFNQYVEIGWPDLVLKPPHSAPHHLGYTTNHEPGVRR